MKSTKLKFSVILTLMLLQTPAFCDAIVDAIDDLRYDMKTEVGKTIKEQKNTTDILSQFFIVALDSNRKPIIDPETKQPISIFHQELKKQLEALYKSSSGSSGDNKADIKGVSKAEDLLRKDQAVKEPSDSFFYNDNVKNLLTINQRVAYGLNKQLAKSIAYNKKPLEGINIDKAALLLQPAEGGSNDIVIDKRDKKAKILGVPLKAVEKGSEFGSLAYDPNEKNNDDKIPDTLNFNTLVGPSGYTPDQVKSAKLFVNQVLQVSPIPTIFFIPDSKDKEAITKDPKGHPSVGIYIPIPDPKGSPYSSVLVRTDIGSCGGDKDPSCVEYNEMLNFLNSNDTYQSYKMKYRSMLALRTLYLESILRSFQERLRLKDQDKSLIEKEDDMALSGLTKQYYDGLKTKSTADINLENIYTMNKVVYFLYKLHKDTERAQLMLAFGGIQSQFQDMVDKQKFVDPIAKIIQNKCWDLKLDPAKGGIEDSTDRANFCKSPISSTN